MSHQFGCIRSTAWAWLVIAGAAWGPADASERAPRPSSASESLPRIGGYPAAPSVQQADPLMQNMAWEAAEGSAGTADWQATGVDTQLGDLASEVARLREQVQQLSEEVELSTPSDQSLPTVRATGQLHSDFMFFGQDAANMAAVGDIQDGAVFRRARFGVLGSYGEAEYQVDMDFAVPGRPSFLDVYAGLNVPTIGRVRVGHFFEPFSLERNTSNRFMTFLERSLLDEAFVPARNLGILLNHANAAETLTRAVGGFRTDSDNYGDSVGDDGGRSLSTRVTWLPWYDSASDGRTLVHLGGPTAIAIRTMHRPNSVPGPKPGWARRRPMSRRLSTRESSLRITGNYSAWRRLGWLAPSRCRPSRFSPASAARRGPGASGMVCDDQLFSDRGTPPVSARFGRVRPRPPRHRSPGGLRR